MAKKGLREAKRGKLMDESGNVNIILYCPSIKEGCYWVLFWKICFTEISDKVAETMEGSSIIAKIILQVVTFFCECCIPYFFRFSGPIFSIFPDHFCVKFLGNITLKFSDLVKFHQNSLILPWPTNFRDFSQFSRKWSPSYCWTAYLAI